jgi:hypothetical protein
MQSSAPGDHPIRPYEEAATLQALRPTMRDPDLTDQELASRKVHASILQTARAIACLTSGMTLNIRRLTSQLRGLRKVHETYKKIILKYYHQALVHSRENRGGV